MELKPLRPSNLIRVMPAKEVRSDARAATHLLSGLRPPTTCRLLRARRGRRRRLPGPRQGARRREPARADASRWSPRCGPLGALVVVNDRLDVALASGADGVHLGRGRSAGRRGASARARPGRRRHLPGPRPGVGGRGGDGADYAGFGPVFATASKAGLPAPLGTEAVRRPRASCRWSAIGGIDAATARAVRDAGAARRRRDRRDLATTRSGRRSEGARRGGRLMRVTDPRGRDHRSVLRRRAGPARPRGRGRRPVHPARGASYAAAGMLSPSAEVWHGEDDAARPRPAQPRALARRTPPAWACRCRPTGTLLVGSDHGRPAAGGAAVLRCSRPRRRGRRCSTGGELLVARADARSAGGRWRLAARRPQRRPPGRR